MILKSVTLKHFRGYRDETTACFDGQTFQVVAGENGAGKSTLLAAIQQALLTNHNAAGKRVDTLRPWGTDLAPEVTVEFEHDGSEYRLWKRFLDKPRAKLEKRGRRNEYTIVSEGRQADTDVRSMLGGTDSDGGRMQVLLASQGGLPLEELSGNLVNDIREILGGQLSGPAGLKLEKAARKRYETFFTPGRGTEKGPIVEIRKNLGEAEKTASDLRDRLSLIEQSRDKASRARQHKASLDEQAAALQPGLREAEAFETQARELESQLNLACAQARAADTAWRLEDQKIQEIKTAGKDLARLRDAAPGIEKSRRDSKAAHEAAVATLASGKRRHADAAEWNTLTGRLQTACAELQRVEELEAERERLRAGISQLNAPDSAVLDRIRSVDAELGLKRARLEALLIRVEVTAECDLASLEVQRGEPAGIHTLAADSTLAASGEGEVMLRLPGVARLRVTGPSGNASSLRSRIASLENERQELMSPFGASSVQELAARAERRQGLEAQHAEVMGELAGRRAAAVLREETAADRVSRQALLGAHPEWEAQPPDVDALRMQGDAAEAAERIARSSASEADFAWRSHQERAKSLESRYADLQSDGLTMAQREESLARRRRECDTAGEKLNGLKQEQAALPPDALTRAGVLRQRLAVLTKEASDSQREMDSEETRQRTWLEQAPQDALATAEEAAEDLRGQKAATELKMESARRVWQTLERCKAEALEGLVDPVAEKATKIFEQITGTRVAEIELNNGFVPSAMVPDASGETAEIDQLSGGEREQVWAATRLALADVLAPSGRHVVVFDDVFAYTDNTRLERILALLEDRRDRMQFLILTCHPERYAGLTRAQWLHVEGCTVAAAETAGSLR